MSSLIWKRQQLAKKTSRLLDLQNLRNEYAELLRETDEQLDKTAYEIEEIRCDIALHVHSLMPERREPVTFESLEVVQ